MINSNKNHENFTSMQKPGLLDALVLRDFGHNVRLLVSALVIVIIQSSSRINGLHCRLDNKNG